MSESVPGVDSAVETQSESATVSASEVQPEVESAKQDENVIFTTEANVQASVVVTISDNKDNNQSEAADAVGIQTLTDEDHSDAELENTAKAVVFVSVPLQCRVSLHGATLCL